MSPRKSFALLFTLFASAAARNVTFASFFQLHGSGIQLQTAAALAVARAQADGLLPHDTLVLQGFDTQGASKQAAICGLSAINVSSVGRSA